MAARGVRKVLFDACRTLSATTPSSRTFDQKLVEQKPPTRKGRPYRRHAKDLVILNAIARDRHPWKHLEPLPNA